MSDAVPDSYNNPRGASVQLHKSLFIPTYNKPAKGIPNAARNTGELLPPILCADAMDDVALGEAKMGVCESVVGLGGVAVDWGASVVDWRAACSRTRRTEVLV